MKNLSYEEYKSLFDQIDERPKLYNPDDESALRKLSRFSRENPDTYMRYRQRMRKENEIHYSGNKLPWER